MIRDKQFPVSLRPALNACAQAFEPVFILDPLVDCFLCGLVYSARMSCFGQIRKRSGSGNALMSFLLDSLGDSPGKANHILNFLLSEPLRNPIECFIREIFSAKARSPFEELDELPAQNLVLLGRAMLVWV